MANTHVVEIEWPLSGTDVAQSFTPCAIVRLDGDGAVPPPAVDHQILFKLYGPNSGTGVEELKSQQPSAMFDPSGEPTVSPPSPLTTDVVGSHRLEAILKDLTASTTDDTDEELDLNITTSGRANRDVGSFIIEE